MNSLNPTLYTLPGPVSVPTNVCLIWNKVHVSHDWWYTDEGGGHMVYEDFAHPEKGDKKHWCPGVEYVPTHRGYPTSKWCAPKTPWDYKPTHRGVPNA